MAGIPRARRSQKVAYRTDTKLLFNAGVSKLARECEVTDTAIRYHMSRGRDQAAIRRYYADKKALEGEGLKSNGGRSAGGGNSIGGKSGGAPNRPVVPSRFVRPSVPPAHPGVRGGGDRGQRAAIQSDDEILADAEAAQSQEESFTSAQRRRVVALADAQEIANAIKRGEWIELKRVQVWGEGVVKNTIGLVMRVPGQLRDPIAAETDPVKCDEMMTGELKRVVGEIQKMEELWKAK